MRDTFSVAMCTYNGSRYLRAQLESIGNQTRPPNELVICDDVSSDDTTFIIERFAASAPFPVRLEVNTRNLGSTKNFEKAIGLCEGTVIALSDQDDVWSPEKLETMEARFRSAPTVGLVFSDADVVDEDLQPLGARLWDSIGFDEKARHQVRAEDALDVLLTGWTVTGATMAFRSEFRQLVLPVPSDIPMIHDGWIALVIAAVADVLFIDQPLIKYRQHEKQQIGVKSPIAERSSGIKNLRQAMKRTNSYGQLISIGCRVRSRLVESSAAFGCTEALRRLDARIDHMRVRQGLPESKLKRVPPVFRELLSRRYHRYSNGLNSAIKDLLN
jgi:glycosyltransferase involved in cell wall biosynthesis